MRVARAAVLFSMAVAIAAPVSAADDGAAWRIERGEIRVDCPMTLGGSFAVTTRAVAGTLTEGQEPVPWEGSIDVDLRTLDSGIALRDAHMRDNYLEVGRPDFDKATLSGLRIDGADARTFQGRTTFSGTFRLHGVTRSVGGTVAVRRSGRTAHIEAGFTIALADYDIAKPQYLGVGVKNELTVHVTLLVGSVTTGLRR